MRSTPKNELEEAKTNLTQMVEDVAQKVKDLKGLVKDAKEEMNVSQACMPVATAAANTRVCATRRLQLITCMQNPTLAADNMYAVTIAADNMCAHPDDCSCQQILR